MKDARAVCFRRHVNLNLRGAFSVVAGGVAKHRTRKDGSTCLDILIVAVVA